MKQPIEAKNFVDDNGNPDGGYVTGVGLIIDWQQGPLGRGADRIEPNGAFVETVLEAAKQRLEFYQVASDARFACSENAEAINYITQALTELNRRTQEREARDVEGTHEP